MPDPVRSECGFAGLSFRAYARNLISGPISNFQENRSLTYIRDDGLRTSKASSGFTLIELIIFIVVIGVATTGLFVALNSGVVNSVDPIYQTRALELAQAQMDEILSRRFDENSPSGGIPACDSASGLGCTAAGSFGPDGEASRDLYDDVDDFDGQNFSPGGPYTGFNVSISVAYAGTDLTSLALESAKRINVVVTPPVGQPVSLSAYKANF